MYPLIVSTEFPNSEQISQWVAKYPNSCWLDSFAFNRTASLYSYVLIQPLATLTVNFDGTGILKSIAQQKTVSNPFRFLDQWLKQIKGSEDSLAPFMGGVVGFISYEAYQLKLSLRAKLHDGAIPAAFFLLVDTGLILDHQKNQAWIFSWGLQEDLKTCQKKIAEQRIEDFKKIVSLSSLSPWGRGSGRGVDKNQSLDSKKKYLKKIQTIQTAITRGDCYQVNLSQKFELPGNLPADEFYLKLRKQAQAPQMAFINLGETKIYSASPEVLLEIEQGRIRSYPIKGTRPRHTNHTVDQKLREELLINPKDAAELLMIVDLVRNDLGKVCEYGSVRVSKLKELLSLPQVYHLVACVEGKLKAGVSFFEALWALFPGGSITGAPKLKAIEIINQLEDHARGIYTGSIGYISFSRNATFNIAIRTAVQKRNALEYFAGGGIVVDSDPEAEYAETLDKSRGFFQAL